MRNLGIILLGLGGFGFFYCGDKATTLGLPADSETLSVEQLWKHESVRWETGRWVCALGGAIGVMLLIVPTRG